MDAAIDTEKWLRQNTGWCERLHARVSPNQCSKNKSRGQTGFEPMYSPCLKCSGITPGKTMEKTKDKKGGKQMKIYCQNCERKAPNAGRGLCQRCYQAKWQEGKLQDYELKNAVVVGQEQKQEKQAQPQPEPQPDPQPETSTQEATQEEDPLAGAELLGRRTKAVETPIATISNHGTHLYLNAAAVKNFKINEYQFVLFFRRAGEMLLLLTNSAEPDSFKLTKKDKKNDTVTISISIKSIASMFEWQAKQTLQVKETARPDVVKLVEYGD